MRVMLTVVLGLMLTACGQRPDDTSATQAKSTAPAPRVQSWMLPTQTGASAPDLRQAPDGRLLLSWLQAEGEDAHRFLFAAADAQGAWQHDPRVIAADRPLFANWADTPHILATPDGALWAHWLQRVGKRGGTYDVVLARSADAGQTWATEAKVNDDGTETEHGFATMWAEGQDRIGIAWLDGRHTSGHGHGSDHGGGPMTLRTATFDAALGRHDESERDASTCDCCQTTSAWVDGGPMLAWRDRTQDEIRDIVMTHRKNGEWQKETVVHADGWHIAGCPVNGPSMAAHDGRVLIAWFTGAQDTPSIRIAMNTDGAFGAMQEVDSGADVLGRVAVALDARQAWVAWLREEAGQQSVMLARYTPDLARELERTEVAKLQARGRVSGFPKLISDGATAWMVWTDVEGDATLIRGARIRAN